MVNLLMEQNGLVKLTPLVRSKLIDQHETWFILEMETVDKI